MLLRSIRDVDRLESDWTVQLELTMALIPRLRWRVEKTWPAASSMFSSNGPYAVQDLLVLGWQGLGHPRTRHDNKHTVELREGAPLLS